MYNGYNDENNLYHYSYRDGDRPWESYGDYQPAAPKEKKPKRFWERSGVRIAALLLACAVVAGGCGFGGAALYRSVRKDNATLQQSHRGAATVTVKEVDGQKLMTPTEVYAANVDSVVSINCSSTTANIFGQNVETASAGSGFIITADGYIVTNQHVVSGASSVKVTLYNGESYDAKVIGGDSDYDVAVLKVEASKFKPVTLGKNSNLNVGDSVLAIGNPLGELTFSMTQGIVSCCDRAINVDGTPFNMIQVDASINPGNSGGPLLNLYGEVVGIVSAKYSSYSNTAVEGLGFALPMDDVQAIITDIMENGQVTGKPYLAITASTMTEAMAAQYNIHINEGVFVFSVQDGGAGEKAGLKLGDVITKVDDIKITSMTDLSTAKKNYKAGDTVTLTVFREGKSITLPLTFDEQPQVTGDEKTEQQMPSYGGGMDDFYNYFFGNRR